jgi:hypothetical protein
LNRDSKRAYAESVNGPHLPSIDRLSPLSRLHDACTMTVSAYELVRIGGLPTPSSK